MIIKNNKPFYRQYENHELENKYNDIVSAVIYNLF